MEEKDFIKDLFQEKLSNFETPVRPELWSAVSSSIGAGGAASATGFSILTKWIIGLTIATGSVGSLWYAFSKDEKTSTSQKTTHMNSESSSSEIKSTIKSAENKENQVFQLNDNSKIGLEKTKELEMQNPQESNTFEPSPAEFLQEKFEPEEKVEKSVVSSSPEAKPQSKSNKSVEENKNVENKNLPEVSEMRVSMPNVFTPNGDGSNDYLAIPELDVEDFSLVVLDEKGKTIFTTTSLDFQWDGRMMNGEMAPSGNYVYFFTGKDRKGKAVTKYSPLNIRY